MSVGYASPKSLLMCAAIALFVTACAGKDDVSPVDVERQAFADLRDQIRETVDDRTRKAEAIRIVRALEKSLADLRGTARARKDRVIELNADYDTSRADFEAFLAGVEVEVRENKDQVALIRRALLSVLTAEEFSVVAKSHTKAMNAAIQTIQAI